MFLLQYPFRQGRGRVVVVYRHPYLCNHGAAIDRGGNEMDAGTML